MAGSFPAALTVDVEEWYHNCCIEEYVQPDRRPPLMNELDHLIPALLDLLESLPARATLFVLGEVADRCPHRIREAAARGHEIACHGDLHLRANSRPEPTFRADLLRAKSKLEDLTGQPILGFRAPEWSLRSPANPRFRTVVECGFAYDSSLVRAIGSGSPDNPTGPTRFLWPDGLSLLEFPPLVWAGPLRLPAGGWCGRLARPTWLRTALARAQKGGLAPVVVVHPWEVVDRPVPGILTGLGRFLHEAGRLGFRDRFQWSFAGVRFEPIGALHQLCLRGSLDSDAMAGRTLTAPAFVPATAPS